MFKKLIGSLPFSPSLVGQLGFYVRRLKQEETTRRAGLVFTAMAVAVQGLIVFAPAETQAASSNNDIIYGGFKDKADLLRIYDKGKDAGGRDDIKQIYTYFGVTRDDLKNTYLGRINSKDKDGDIYSTGRIAYHKANSDEKAKKITGTDTTVYMRKLRAFDAGNQIKTGNGYAALIGKRAVDGEWFAIVLACGNVDFVKLPPAPKPAPKSIKVCELATKKIITIKEDDFDKKKHSKDLNDCKVTPPKPVTPTPTPTPVQIQVCELSTKKVITINEKDFDNKKYSKNLNDCAVVPTPVTIQVCELASKKVITIDQNSYDATKHSKNLADCVTPTTPTTPTTPVTPTTPTPTPTPEVCTYNEELPKSSTECKPCEGDSTLWYKDSGCDSDFKPVKTVSNLTRSIANADKTTANAGDRLEYTLSVTNSGKVTDTYVIKDTISDILEYTDVIDQGSGTFTASDGTTGANTARDMIVWPTVTIAPGQTAQKKFVVQVKSSIPATAQNISNPESYNCSIVNSFGQTTTVTIDCPAPKGVEEVTSSLPSTGPTENMLLGGAALAVVAYFYARSRQMGREVRLIRRDFNAGTI